TMSLAPVTGDVTRGSDLDSLVLVTSFAESALPSSANRADSADASAIAKQAFAVRREMIRSFGSMHLAMAVVRSLRIPRRDPAAACAHPRRAVSRDVARQQSSADLPRR